MEKEIDFDKPGKLCCFTSSTWQLKKNHVAKFIGQGRRWLEGCSKLVQFGGG